MYSQNNEEAFIVNFFAGKVGRFLDVGAYDGVQLSNTRRLLELGWSGVLVEPAARNFVELQKNCLLYPHVLLIQAAVSAHRSLRRLHLDLTPGREWSSTVNSELLEIGSVMDPSPQQVFVPVIPITDLDGLGPFHYISIDAEWEDLAILQALSERMVEGIELLSVEPRSLEERARMKDFAAKVYRFKVVHETPENLFLAPSL